MGKKNIFNKEKSNDCGKDFCFIHIAQPTQVDTSKPLAWLLGNGLPPWPEAELWYARRLREMKIPEAFVEFDKSWMANYCDRKLWVGEGTTMNSKKTHFQNDVKTQQNDVKNRQNDVKFFGGFFGDFFGAPEISYCSLTAGSCSNSTSSIENCALWMMKRKAWFRKFNVFQG